jgi:hypothetical protein
LSTYRIAPSARLVWHAILQPKSGMVGDELHFDLHHRIQSIWQKLVAPLKAGLLRCARNDELGRSALLLLLDRD